MTGKFVLLVEDDADDEKFTLRALSKAQVQHEIKVVRDGEECLDFLFCTGKYSDRCKEDLPVIILLDLKLPKLNGHEVLSRLRSEADTKLLPVIILTSSREDADLIKSYSKGANSYIVKPVNSAQYTECVQLLSTYWLNLNQAL